MKIFCITGNYGVGSESSELEWYILPDSTVVKGDNPFFVPDFDTEFKGYPTLAIRIERLGKCVGAKFAERYYSEVAPVVVAQASRLLQRLRREGKPWDRAVVFDRCCMLGDFMTKEELFNLGSMEFCMDDKYLRWDLSALGGGIDQIVEIISRENTLKIGDLILLGFPADGFELIPGMTITAKTATDTKLEVRVK